MDKGHTFFLGAFVALLVVFVIGFFDSSDIDATDTPDLGRFEVVFEENQGVYVAEDEITGLLYYVTYDKANSCIESVCPYNIVDEDGTVRQAVKGVDYQ